MLPVYDPQQLRPLLMSGVHGANTVRVTPEMVKAAFNSSAGKPIPILPGHHERVDSVRALGSVVADKLVLNYKDENGKHHDVAILGHTERLNRQGEHALSEGEYLYYSPYLKRDPTAGWVIEHEAWTNIPRQQGLKPLAFGDSSHEQDLIPGPQGRVALAEGESMGFTEKQKQELNEMIASSVAEGLKPINDELGKVKQETAALADTKNTPDTGDNNSGEGDERIAELEKRLALSDARAASGEFMARYKGRIDDNCLPILGAIRQQLALSEGTVELADGKETAAVALADQLADALVKNRERSESMKLTTIKLSEGDGESGKTSVEEGRDAAKRYGR
jgi:hypothetical protein